MEKFRWDNTFAYMVTQLTHAQTTKHTHNAHITVVCDNITSPANIGMIFRICEAMGVEMVYICGEGIVPNIKTQRASRATAHVIPNKYINSAEKCIRQLKQNGYKIIAIELTDCSTDLRSFVFENGAKYVLIAGAENWGISHEVLQLADTSLMIPLFGHNSSMNVATALSICLFECVRQLIPVAD